jgi:hypothetical protein
MDLRVFITNSNLTDHPSYNSPVLTLVDRIASPKDIAHPNLLRKLSELEYSPPTEATLLNKSVIDLTLAVQHCYLNSTAPYVAFFEDDIIAAEGWFWALKTAVHEANTLAIKHDKEWLDLRLFNPIVELHWSVNLTVFEKILQLIGIFVVLVIVSGVSWKMNKYVQRATWNSSSPKGFSDKAMATLCLFTLPLFTFLFFQSGQSIIPRRPGVSIQPWGCCTQGAVFPREQIPRLVNSVLNHREEEEYHAFDTTVKLYAAEEGILRMVLDPPMVQHVGFKSVVNSKTSRIFPWSPQFEDLDKQTLEKEHQERVKQLY